MAVELVDDRERAELPVDGVAVAREDPDAATDGLVDDLALLDRQAGLQRRRAADEPDHLAQQDPGLVAGRGDDDDLGESDDEQVPEASAARIDDLPCFFGAITTSSRAPSK